MANLHASLFSLCAERGDRFAFQLQRDAGGYRKLSYKEYREQALRLSRALRLKGIGAGDRVLIASENCPEWTIVALAVMNRGATLVPVASIASHLEFRNILEGSRPKICFISSRCQAARQHIDEIVAVHPSEIFFWDTQSAIPLERLLTDTSPDEVDESIDENKTALLIYTSGTTGNPKGVPISHKNILTNAKDAVKAISASSADSLVSVLPLSHMFEFTGGYVVPMLVGAPITYTKSLRSEDLIGALKENHATILVGVPLLFEIIARNLQTKINEMPAPIRRYFHGARKIVRERIELGRYLFFPIHYMLGGKLKFFMAGGSRLHPQVFEFYRDLGILVLQGYGLTETSPVLTVTNPENAAPDHVGKNFESVEIGIFSERAERLLSGQEGEIWARGPSVFSGYLDESHNKSAFFDGWFRTGDLGVIDQFGLLHITGRQKDIIVTAAGKNVYPEEIEALVLASGQFLEVCVLGLEENGHEQICLVLIPDRAKFKKLLQKDDVAKEAKRIAADITRTLSDYKWPQRVEVLFDELPKTSTKKIKKHEVRKVLQARLQQKDTTVRAGDLLNLEDELEKALAEAIAVISHRGMTEISKNDSLSQDLAFDSLTFVELLSTVERSLGFQTSTIDFTAIRSVDDLLHILRVNAGSRKRRSIFETVPFAEFSAEQNKKLIWKIPRFAWNIVLRLYLRKRHGFEVEGLENIPENTPLIFAPNHTSHFDMLSIAGAIPQALIHRTYAVAAKDYFFNTWLKSLFARVFINALAFDRRGRIEESMAKCREVLDNGDSLTIFPEGTRSPDGKLQSFKPGVGQLLASHPKAKGLPVYISGAFDIFPKGSTQVKPGILHIRFGKAISFSDLPPIPESYKKVADRLREEVVKLKPST